MNEPTPMERADACLRAADMHLKRVEVLQGAEWRITVLCWTVLVAVTGASLLHPDALKNIVVMGAGCVFYLFVAFAYLRLYQPQSYQSLNTERNYYVFMRNLAFDQLGMEQAKAPDRHGALFGHLQPAVAADVRKSKVYHFRRAVTIALSLLGLAVTVAPFASARIV